MTDSELAAQLVFPGHQFGADEIGKAEALVELGVGGFCLYGGDVREVADFTARLQEKAKVPLLFCADYEDGVASQSPGGTRLPSNMGLGAAGDEALAVQKGVLTAVEAKALGVRWVLAPVVDLATEPRNPIVNVRAFGADPGLCARMARAYLRGLRLENVLGCLKHFPGHGETVSDSHLGLARVDVPLETLRNRELRVYRELAKDADSVMSAHLAVPALESEEGLPASLSQAVVGKTLRGELGYGGLVSTDALNMRAIKGRIPELDAAAKALMAGNDVLLVPADPRALILALQDRLADDAALARAARTAWERLERAKRAARLLTDRGIPDPEEFSRVGCAKHRQTAERLAERCLAWARKPETPPAEISYLEVESESPEEWLGKDFVSELQAQGVRVSPWSGGSGALVVGCFLRPHAYTGRIQYEDSELSRPRQALARAGWKGAVSFGSPFLLGQLGRLDGGLCSFAGDAHAQKAAARALAGKIAAAGKMPAALGG